VLIDIPDVGVRYFTYTTHLYRLLECLRDAGLDLPIFIIDKPNPAGSKIEGTPLPAHYASFVGLEGLIHRHGLSTGQLATWMRKKLNYPFLIHPISVETDLVRWPIPPSPNIPGLSTIELYPGQCFWEATTWSEGRGTTRPFEIFGHPELTWEAARAIADDFQQKFAEQALLRPLRFIPAFHKHAGEDCVGFQLHLLQPATYHCIFGSLYLMRLASEYFYKGYFWRPGPYEFDSGCTAAEVLIGDDILMDYVNGKVEEAQLSAHLTKAETDWRKMVHSPLKY